MAVIAKREVKEPNVEWIKRGIEQHRGEPLFVLKLDEKYQYPVLSSRYVLLQRVRGPSGKERGRVIGKIDVEHFRGHDEYSSFGIRKELEREGMEGCCSIMCS